MVFCSKLASWEVQLSVLNILVFVSLVVCVSNCLHGVVISQEPSE